MVLDDAWRLFDCDGDYAIPNELWSQIEDMEPRPVSWPSRTGWMGVFPAMLGDESYVAQQGVDILRTVDGRAYPYWRSALRADRDPAAIPAFELFVNGTLM